MAITSVGYDGTVDEKQFREIMGFSASSEYGVVEPGAFAASSVAGQVLQVRLTPGTAWTAGVVDKMDTADTVQLEPVTSGRRWDMIVLRRDYQPVKGTTTLQVIKGSSSMTLPTRQSNLGVLDEQPLWLVKLEKDKATPTQFVDLRVWARNGGATANHDLVRSYMNATGTAIEINGTLWLLRNGANNQNEWVKPIELALAAGSSTSSTASDAANKLVAKDANGFFGVLDPQVSTHPASKKYVDQTRMGGSIASGATTVTPNQKVTESGETYYRGSAWVNFPSGRFSASPNVVVSENTEVPGRVRSVSVTDVSKTGFRAHAARNNNTGVTLTWVAVQATA